MHELFTQIHRLKHLSNYSSQQLQLCHAISLTKRSIQKIFWFVYFFTVWKLNVWFFNVMLSILLWVCQTAGVSFIFNHCFLLQKDSNQYSKLCKQWFIWALILMVKYFVNTRFTDVFALLPLKQKKRMKKKLINYTSNLEFVICYSYLVFCFYWSNGDSSGMEQSVGDKQWIVMTRKVGHKLWTEHRNHFLFQLIFHTE